MYVAALPGLVLIEATKPARLFVTRHQQPTRGVVQPIRQRFHRRIGTPQPLTRRRLRLLGPLAALIGLCLLPCFQAGVVLFLSFGVLGRRLLVFLHRQRGLRRRHNATALEVKALTAPSVSMPFMSTSDSSCASKPAGGSVLELVNGPDTRSNQWSGARRPEAYSGEAGMTAPRKFTARMRIPLDAWRTGGTDAGPHPMRVEDHRRAGDRLDHLLGG